MGATLALSGEKIRKGGKGWSTIRHYLIYFGEKFQTHPARYPNPHKFQMYMRVWTSILVNLFNARITMLMKAHDRVKTRESLKTWSLVILKVVVVLNYQYDLMVCTFEIFSRLLLFMLCQHAFAHFSFLCAPIGSHVFAL